MSQDSDSLSINPVSWLDGVRLNLGSEVRMVLFCRFWQSENAMRTTNNRVLLICEITFYLGIKKLNY